MAKILWRSEARDVAEYAQELYYLGRIFHVERVQSWEDGMYDDQAWIQTLRSSLRRVSFLVVNPGASLARALAKGPNDVTKRFCLLDDFVYALSVEKQHKEWHEDKVKRRNNVPIAELQWYEESIELEKRTQKAASEVRILYLKKIFGDRYKESFAEEFSVVNYHPPAIKARFMAEGFMQRDETTDLAPLRKVEEDYVLESKRLHDKYYGD